MRKGKDLVFDYKQCIRCFCCLEVCPEGAISIKPGWALKIVGRGQKAENRKQQAEE
jgi:formate hydrogenlyase subunit 6/NADH:ubiquinone oxidoreductase subunit I